MAEEKSVCIITFTGLAGDWRTWKFKFMAKATALGYRGVLLGTINVPDDDEDIDKDDIGAEELLAARKANVMAYSALGLACEGAALGLVEGSVTEGLPNGDAGLAWRNLCRKYEPNTRMSLVSLKKEFAECKLEDVDSDPEVWVRELEHLHLRIRGVNAENALTDEDMMAHILANLPVEYSELITTVESELDREDGDFGLDDLMTRIRGFYKRKFENRATDKEEVALAAGQFLTSKDSVANVESMATRRPTVRKAREMRKGRRNDLQANVSTAERPGINRRTASRRKPTSACKTRRTWC